ncbi:FHA domain-containing protein [Frigidibacter sp. RF13]|uniref:FHA domain-containing protein n=1 Tax=Frigidibacter sp. RF13 TaxID=2997340 RepID=UPI0022705885|nr:FHA domain-containing protein [Frigidibacter sp. RF13]MCY1128268.1 FHA domain-containing protein [Frigidibacter sp. RF13]
MAKQDSSASYWFDRDNDPAAQAAEPARRRSLSPLNLFARKLRAREEQQGTEGAEATVERPLDAPAEVEAPAPVAAATEAETPEMAAPEVVAEAAPVADPVASMEKEAAPSDGPMPDAMTAAAILAAVRAPEPEAAPEPVVAEVKPVTAATAEPEVKPVQDAAPEPAAEAAPEPGPSRRSSRVKTTFLGFEHSDGRVVDVFARDDAAAAPAAAAPQVDRVMYPVGWLAIVDGPGRGNSIALQAGVSQIGRGDDQAIQLNFGDMAISRSNHAAIAFDHEDRRFYLGHGGKTNIVRLNGKPVLSTEALESGDKIRIGETTLRFVALCGPDFHWTT